MEVIDFSNRLPRFADRAAYHADHPDTWGGGRGKLAAIPDLTMTALPVDVTDDDSGTWITLMLGTVPFAFRVTPAQGDALTGTSLDLMDRDDAIMALENTFAARLNAIEAALGVSAKITAVAQAEPTDFLGGSYCYNVAFAWDSGETHSVPCKTSEDGFLLLATHLTAAAGKYSDMSKRPILPCRMTLPSFEIALSDLRSLRVGDALMLDRATAQDITLMVGQRHGILLKSVGEGQASVGMLQSFHDTQAPSRGQSSNAVGHLPNEIDEEKMGESNEFEAQVDGLENADGTAVVADTAVEVDDVGQSLGDITLPVQAVLSEFTASLSDIEKLRPGALIDMPRGPIGKIDIVVSNVKIGEGQLIQIGDDTAIEIVSLNQG